jgi:hypothetical protein
LGLDVLPLVGLEISPGPGVAGHRRPLEPAGVPLFPPRVPSGLTASGWGGPSSLIFLRTSAPSKAWAQLRMTLRPLVVSMTVPLQPCEGMRMTALVSGGWAGAGTTTSSSRIRVVSPPRKQGNTPRLRVGLTVGELTAGGRTVTVRSVGFCIGSLRARPGDRV